MNATRVGAFELMWGESLRWDDLRQRLYFVDCAAQTLHWLDGGEPPLQTLKLPSLPTGLALTSATQLVICLDDGLNLVDPDQGTVELLAPYPDGIHGRANDMTVDPAGRLVTGTLNMGPGPGSLWQYSAAEGWRHLDEDTGNTNGPVFTTVDGAPTLVVADTVSREVHAYEYADSSDVGSRRVVADGELLGGAPDGATVDADGRVWWCALGGASLACLPLDAPPMERIPVPPRYPSDVTFGGPAFDRLFVTSIAFDLGDGPPGTDATFLHVVDDVGAVGVAELRYIL